MIKEEDISDMTSEPSVSNMDAASRLQLSNQFSSVQSPKAGQRGKMPFLNMKLGKQDSYDFGKVPSSLGTFPKELAKKDPFESAKLRRKPTKKASETN